MSATREAAEPEFLELDRRFQVASEDPRGDYSSLRFFGLPDRGLDWAALLVYSCAVILGEAGSGKTRELRGRAAQLRASGHHAFFVPIEDAAEHGANALPNQHDYLAWQGSSDEATIFLDSIDEARLRNRSLNDALIRLRNGLGSAWSRVRLVISSRATDWRQRDLDAARDVAQTLATPGPGGRAIQVVHILPLDDRQFGLLARRYGLLDAAPLLGAVRETQTWEFIDRPLDVGWLVSYWQENQRLGSLTDVIDSSITQRLQESMRDPTLSLERAREGAATLALVAVLAGRTAFALPGAAGRLDGDDSIDPVKALPDWSPAQIGDLLTRGLFDDQTYGRVRIHHRRVQEYLAADRLRALVARGLSSSALESLFFQKRAGRVVVPTHLSATLAWLCPWVPELRRKAIHHAPHHLVDEADPAALTSDDRRNVLRSLAGKPDTTRYLHFDRAGLARFASPELTEDIRALLLDSAQPEHLRGLLLRLIQAGPLQALAETAIAVALEDDASESLCIAAMRAALRSGSPAVASRLRPLLERSIATDHDVAAALITELFPQAMSVDEVLRLIGQVRRPARTFTEFDRRVAQLAERCAPGQASELLVGIVKMVRGPDRRAGRLGVDPERAWLAEALAWSMGKAAHDPATSDDLLVDGLDLFEAALRHRDAPGFSLREKVYKLHPELPRRAFWHHVARLAALSPSKRIRYVDVAGKTIHLGESCLDWLAKDALTAATPNRQLLAFEAFVTVSSMGAPADRFAQASDLAERSPTLAKRWARMRNPPLSQPSTELSRIMLRSRALDRAQVGQHEMERAALERDVDRIRAGANLRALAYLCFRFPSQRPRASEDAPDFSSIAAEYGQAVAEAARSGLVAYWRGHPAPARHESPANSRPYVAVIGLVSLQLDVDSGLRVEDLDDELARRAVMYAIWSMNQFPDWLDQLAVRRPALLVESLARSLDLDFDEPETGQSTCTRVLWMLEHATVTLRSICSRTVLALLDARDPARVDCLRAAIGVARSGIEEDPRWSSLCRDRAQRLEAEPPRTALWWCEWLATDTSESLTWLEETLARHSAPQALAEEVLARLARVAGPKVATPHWLSRDRATILRLLPIAHTYVSPRGDRRSGEAHFVERRDECEELRRVLLPWLTALSGDETVQALEQLSRAPWLADNSEWLRFLAERRATLDAAPMEERAAIQFVTAGWLQPRDGGELFELTKQRVLDVAHTLENGDFSVRAIYAQDVKAPDETHFQILLASQLEERACGQYDVTRETEVIDGNRTDIRLHGKQGVGRVVIEVKVAEKWSYSELDSALVQQVVERYMRDAGSRWAMLVLCSSGEQRTWRRDGDNLTLTFRDLVAALQERAQEIRQGQSGVDALEVIGIDFHPHGAVGAAAGRATPASASRAQAKKSRKAV